MGLGSPQDRLPPPGGARRVYHSDESWQDALEDLAETSRCIVGAMASSANTDWELSRIRQLDLQSKLFLVSPPAEGEDASDPIGDSTSWWRFFAAVANAYVDNDTDRLTKILARGHAPRALTAAPPVAWSDLARVLTTCGYAVPIDDPGPGAVVGFDSVGTAVLLATAAEDPSDFVDPMIARVG